MPFSPAKNHRFTTGQFFVRDGWPGMDFFCKSFQDRARFPPDVEFIGVATAAKRWQIVPYLPSVGESLEDHPPSGDGGYFTL
jgi:hypothetical protein